MTKQTETAINAALETGSEEDRTKEAEILMYVRRYQQKKDAEILVPLYERMERILRYSAIKYRGMAGAEYEDLMQEGFLALYDALDHYQEEQEVSFSAYFTTVARRRMMRYIERSGLSIRIPYYLRIRARKYKQIAGQLDVRNVPKHERDAILCNRLEIKPSDLRELREVMAIMRLKSLEDENPGTDLTIMETIPGPDNTGEAIEREYQRELSEALRKEIKACGPVHERVIYDQYYLNKSAGVCAAEMGCTESRVLTLRNGAIQKLRKGNVRRRLARFISDAEIFSMGIQNPGFGTIFKQTGTSITERAAIKLMEMERVRSQGATMEQIGENIKKPSND